MAATETLDTVGRHAVAPNPLAKWLPRGVVLAALALGVVLAINSFESYVPIAQDVVIYAIVGLSLNILLGYTGQLSLGHNGFYGIGAFAAAYALTVKHVPFAATFVVAGLAGAVFALVMGVVALRITGLYLALITLVFGLTLEDSLFQVSWLTNGGAGQPADRPSWLYSEVHYFYFCLAFLAAALYLDWVLLRSKTGRALLALKENERVAEAFGINVTAFKLLAFVLSGTLCGVAGALFAYRVGLVVGSGFGFNLALTFVLLTVVGGLGSRVGVCLGAVLFASLGYWLEPDGFLHGPATFLFRFDNAEQFLAGFIGAFGLIITLIQFPGGIGQQLSPLTRWLSGKPFSFHHDTDAGPGTVEGSSVRA